MVEAMRAQMASEELWPIVVGQAAALAPRSNLDLIAEIEGRTRIGPLGWTDRERDAETDWHEFVAMTMPNEPYGWWTIDDGPPYQIRGWANAA